MIINFIGPLSRRVLLNLMRLTLFGLLAVAQPVAADEAAIVEARPALWMVTADPPSAGATYLFGSFHLLPQKYHWFQGPVRDSFEKSDVLVMETQMTPEAMAEIQGLFIENGFFAGDDNLQNHLTAEDYQKMVSYAKNLLGLGEAQARKVKPWFMAIQLSISSIMSAGLDPNSGVDKYLEAAAVRAQKGVAGLETARAQMTALIDHPLPVQTAMLKDTLEKLEDFQSYIDSYLAAWASGDSDRIGETMLEDMAKYKSMYEALLVDRNRKWLPHIEDHIASDATTFIVVGAAHLVGEDGVIRLLRDKGYQVEKIQ